MAHFVKNYIVKNIKEHKKVKIRVEFTYGVITGPGYGIKEQTEGWLGFRVGQASLGQVRSD
jgi:hypothetical protein